jgi:hypothetical protein
MYHTGRQGGFPEFRRIFRRRQGMVFPLRLANNGRMARARRTYRGGCFKVAERKRRLEDRIFAEALRGRVTAERRRVLLKRFARIGNAGRETTEPPRH